MSTQPIVQSNIKWTDQNIIDLIRKIRNDLIKDFLDERFLKSYLDTNYKIRELSLIKLEFIKSNLKELLISPVNVPHYHKVIEQIRETDSASLSEGNDKFFYKEIEGILKKYIY
ncbi:MAG TPA: hypothetical protein VD884_09400 [Ohtaekwangia sp.]|nr:hypothetical protein [Ohtaekwangia sp.]